MQPAFWHAPKAVNAHHLMSLGFQPRQQPNLDIRTLEVTNPDFLSEHLSAGFGISPRTSGI